MRLEWTIDGEKQLSRKLIGLSTNLQDLRIPFQSSADYLKEVFSRDVFETKGAAIGERWKPLSPATVRMKARLGYPATPLVGSGKMQGSFQSIVTSSQATVYNTTEYFKFHQSKAPRYHLPRRVMMKLAERQKETIVKFFHEHLHHALKR